MKTPTQAATVLLATVAMCSAQSFTDDFNRLDSPSVGNGWIDCTSNAGPNLQIQGNRLTTAFASLGDAAAGICRPFQHSGTLHILATLTEMNGHNSTPRRYHTGFAVFNDGAVGHGYGIFVVRSSSVFANSQVILFDGDIGRLDVDADRSRVAERLSPFQFGAQITVGVAFYADGRVTGSITSDGQTFDFLFGSRQIRSTGTNVTIFQVYPSPLNTPSPTYPTLDDVMVCAVPPLQLARAGAQVAVTWAADGTNCDLYATPALVPATWTLVQEQPSLLGDRLTVTLPASDPHRFFRLQKR
jgi:hypothetical protein